MSIHSVIPWEPFTLFFCFHLRDGPQSMIVGVVLATLREVERTSLSGWHFSLGIGCQTI